jgi:hypothetical protein
MVGLVVHCARRQGRILGQVVFDGAVDRWLVQEARLLEEFLILSVIVGVGEPLTDLVDPRRYPLRGASEFRLDIRQMDSSSGERAPF